MLARYISSTINNYLGFEPTKGQKEVIDFLSEFVSPSATENELMILKGYAGTGKTSLVAALVKASEELKIKTVLLAPTGRAAKVLSYYSEKFAYTIHKKIYRRQSSTDGFGLFNLDDNLHTNTLFLVDEASMISNEGHDSGVFGSGHLLSDLMKYVYNDKHCKLVLIGDTAQLPPVGTSLSPALDTEYMEQFGKRIYEFELTEIVRQKKRSGIVTNATILRKKIEEYAKNPFNTKYSFPRLKHEKLSDIEKITGEDLIDKLTEAYDKHGVNNVVVICRSNKRANRYNNGIRNSVMFREEELAKGDVLMIVKNNYLWAQSVPEIDFIANGDIAEVVKITGYSERYGFRFADAVLQFPDYDNIQISGKLLLDTLHLETPALNSEQNKDLFFKISEDFAEIKNKKNRYKQVREHPFFNALQVKYAYAVTCHKAQGGQWEHVFVDQGYITEDKTDSDYLRWLYTAVTRASEKLNLVNFDKGFFE